MRIAFIWPKLGPYAHARLEALGRKVATVAIEMSGKDETYMWNEVVGAVNFQRVTVFPSEDCNRRPVAEVSAALIRALETAKADVVVIPSWGFNYSICALQWCLANQIPTVVATDSSESDKPRRWLKELVKAYTVRHFHTAIVSGTRSKAYVQKLGIPSKNIWSGLDVVDNEYFSSGADAVRLQEAATRIKLSLPSPFFLTICRFVQKKNLFALLRAYSIYRKSSTGGELWDLVICGDGPLVGEINELIDCLELSPFVRLRGFQQYGSLPDYYGLASAFVLPSVEEQWGLVVNEAMASGIPVLVSDRCGCRPELVIDGVTGYGFNPLDPIQLATLMQRLSSEPGLSVVLGRNGRRTISEWSCESLSSQILKAAEAALQIVPQPQSVVSRLVTVFLARKRNVPDLGQDIETRFGLGKTKSNYILLQTAIGDYRQRCLDLVLNAIGDDFHVYSGKTYFDPTITTRVLLGSHITLIRNLFMFRRQLLWQLGMYRHCVGARFLIIEGNPRIISSWVLLLTRRLLGKKTILWMHAWSRRGRKGWTNRVRNLMRRLGSSVLVYTRRQAEELLAAMPRMQIRCAPNAVYRRFEMRAPVTEGDRTAFIYVGRLVSEKKPLLLINAFLRAKAILPSEIELVIIGDGPLINECRDLSENSKYSSSIKITGHISDLAVLEKYYGTSIASVSPGYVGLSITQSLSFGVPMVIARDEPHAPEIEAAQEGKNCVFFEKDSADQLARVMVDFVANREDWSKRRFAIVEDCAREYSVEKMASAIILSMT